MKRIEIKRDANDKVTFTPVSIDNTENVFFINLDPKQPHKPSILKLVGSEQLGPAPSPPSSQCPVPPPAAGTTEVSYGCNVVGHETEKGIINVFAPLAVAPSGTVVPYNTSLFLNARLVVGGKPPYVITGLIVNSKSIPGTSTKPDQMLPIGSEFKLNQDNQGIFVFGTATLLQIYHFTFTVNDSMGRNLQQVQYTLTPPEPASPLEP